MTRVIIDPNVRVRGNGTFSDLDMHVSGPLAVSEEVEVVEPEAGLIGQGRVQEIDLHRRLVYLSVEWASLHPEPGDTHEDGAQQRLHLNERQSYASTGWGQSPHLEGGAYLPAIATGSGALVIRQVNGRPVLTRVSL